MWFFEKINKIHKPLSRLIKKRRERTQMTNMSNEKADISADPMYIKKIIKGY